MMQVHTEAVPDPVQWHEGMLLAPQHFQLLSARYELLLGQAAVGGSLPGWGARHVAIDMARLVAGDFVLTEADIVMPDGLQVCLTRARPLRLDLLAMADALRGGSQTVFVAVPARRDLAASGEMARYHSAECGPVRDETGESEITIPVLRPNVELFAGKALPARLRGVPVARISLREETYVLEDYQPPTPGLVAGSRLREECGAVVGQIREKALLLADRIHGGGLARDTAELWQTRLQLRSLAAALPGVEALLGFERVHPQALYVHMCSLAGQLAPLSHGLVPPLFDPYDHADPAASLRPVLRFCGQAMSEGISEQWQRIRLVFRDGEFSAPSGGWLERALAVPGSGGPAVVLSVRGADTEAMRRWGADALIACPGTKEALLDGRALGAARHPVEYVDGISQAAGTCLLSIEVPSNALLAGEPLLVQGCPGAALAPVEVVLYVRKTPGVPALDSEARAGGGRFGSGKESGH